MPLRRVAMVNRPLRKREAVMGAGIDLDLGIGAVGLHLLFYFLDDLHWRVDVGLSATEIEFGPGLLSGEMWTVGPVSGQLDAVDRSCCLDASGEMRCGVDGVLPAHAVAHGADDVLARGGLAIGVGEKGARILDDQ